MDIADIVNRDYQIRERLTFFKEQNVKHHNCRHVLEDLERTYCSNVLMKYDSKTHMKELGDALDWFGKYQGWYKQVNDDGPR